MRILAWLGVVASFMIVLSLYMFFLSVHPKKHVSPVTPADHGLHHENITLRTEDGIGLDSWFIPANSSSAIIITHGYPFDKGNVLPSNLYLRKYNLLFFDFRAMGKSEGKITTVGWKEQEDLKAAIRFLKDRGIEDIGVVGFSLGAAVAIMTEGDIDAIVADSSYAELDRMIHSMYRPFWLFRYPFVYMTKLYSRLFLGLDTSKVSPLDAIKERKTPVLLIHGSRDSQIDVKNSKDLHSEAPSSELWIIEGADHGMTHAQAGKEYEKRVLDFFKEHLG